MKPYRPPLLLLLVGVESSPARPISGASEVLGSNPRNGTVTFYFCFFVFFRSFQITHIEHRDQITTHRKGSTSINQNHFQQGEHPNTSLIFIPHLPQTRNLNLNNA